MRFYFGCNILLKWGQCHFHVYKALTISCLRIASENDTLFKQTRTRERPQHEEAKKY